MPERDSVPILATMWIAVAIMEIAAVSNGHFGIGFILPLLIATLLTVGFWATPMIRSKFERQTNEEKRKNNSADSMAALLALMDEDERQEFKEQLKQRMLDRVTYGSVDGELPLDSTSLEALMAEDDAVGGRM